MAEILKTETPRLEDAVALALGVRTSIVQELTPDEVLVLLGNFRTSRGSAGDIPGSTAGQTEELTPEEESQILSGLEEAQFLMSRLRNTMDTNIALLEDSVRSVRTAHNIAAESNRMARRRLLREGSSDLTAASK